MEPRSQHKAESTPKTTDQQDRKYSFQFVRLEERMAPLTGTFSGPALTLGSLYPH